MTASSRQLLFLLGVTAIVTSPVAPSGCAITGGIQTDYGTISSDGRTVTIIGDARQLGKPRGFSK